MKRIYSVSFTHQGAELQRKLQAFFAAEGMECTAFAKYPAENCLLLKDSLGDFAKQAFEETEGILFVCAAGIAVRAIAPFIQKKDKDPAVLVLDDTGRYVIPILSGHLGGANLLAEQIGAFLGAEPVITTATDRNARFSVDFFAVNQKAFTVEIHRIKDISSEILKGNPVGFQSDYPVEGKLPLELTEAKNVSTGILISDHREKKPFQTTLHLIPRKVILGVGCRKNIDFDVLYPQIMSVLEEHNLTMEQVRLLASIDLKKEEPALLRLRKEWKLDFRTYPAERLRRLKGRFTPSGFVRSVAGVDNVCERAAWLAAEEEIDRWAGEYAHKELGSGQLPRFLFRKTAGNGVTVAAVELDWRCQF